jgi:Mrp family chromosome partitioning ATPase
MGRVEAELSPGAATGPRPAPSAAPSEAQRQRDAAAAELAAAKQALTEKLLTFRPAHPDAVAAEARLARAQQGLDAADRALARARQADPATAAAAESVTPERRADLERQLVTLRRQIEARRGSLGRAAPPAPPGAPPREAQGAADTVELETEWHRLRLDLDRAREKLHTIQQNTRAADLSAEAVVREGHEEMQILEPAYLPTRPERGRGPVFVAGALVALFAALGYAAARVLLDDTLLDEGDVAAVGGPPVLVAMPPLGPAPPPPERAIVPATHPDEDDGDIGEAPTAPIPSARGLVLCAPAPLVEAVFDDPEVEVIGADLRPDGSSRMGPCPPAALAALRILRARLEQRRGDGSFVVSVMSPGPGEGKTTLALRLAVTLSEADRARVILVEGHFARPRLASALGLCLPPEAGFSAQIHQRRRGRGVAWGIVRLGPSLSILAEPGEVAAHPEAIHATHFEAALAALRRSYEYVIVDGPEVLGCGDANVVEGASDAVLLLARAGATQGAALCRATQQLGERRVLGLVLNEAAPRRGEG